MTDDRPTVCRYRTFEKLGGGIDLVFEAEDTGPDFVFLSGRIGEQVFEGTLDDALARRCSNWNGGGGREDGIQKDF